MTDQVFRPALLFLIHEKTAMVIIHACKDCKCEDAKQAMKAWGDQRWSWQSATVNPLLIETFKEVPTFLPIEIMICKIIIVLELLI